MNHGSRLPESRQATPRNAPLNSDATASGNALVEEDQFLLGSPDERCRVAASRMAALVKESQRENGYTLGTVAHLAGKETPYASKAFDVDDPSSVLKLIAAVLLLDKAGVWIRGTASLTGRVVEDRPRLTPEQERDRLLDTLRRHGSVGAALIAEAFPEVSP